MLKRLLKRPMFWSPLALIACAVWPQRPLDRTALFPVQFANGKYGYVNPHGRVAVAGVWDEAYSFAADGRAVVGDERGYAFIDREGRLVSPPGDVQFEFSYHFRSRFLWQNKAGWLSNSGQLVSFEGGHIPLWKSKPRKRGLREAGKITVEPVWDEIQPFDAANLAAVKTDGKWGFIDRKQKLVIPLEWDSAEPFAKNGLARISKAKRFGFIDRSGKVAIPLEWESALRKTQITTSRFGRHLYGMCSCSK